jgi:hypothetical protein
VDFPTGLVKPNVLEIIEEMPEPWESNRMGRPPKHPLSLDISLGEQQLSPSE